MVLDKAQIEVFLIDSNVLKSCGRTELIQLPVRFKTFPPQAVNVRIGGIVPHDFDYDWDSKTLQYVKNWLRHESDYLKGDIQLSIMDTLWVDSVDGMEVLHSIGHDVRTVSIKNNLLKHKFGVNDSRAMELLKSLAQQAGGSIIPLMPLFVLPFFHFIGTLLIRKFRQKQQFKPNFESNQIFDYRDASHSRFNNSWDESLFDESEVSRLNWTTSTDDDECYVTEHKVNENEDMQSNLLNASSCSTSSAKSDELLRECNDKWAELLWDQFNKIYLGTFYHPGRLYIRNNDASSESRFVCILYNLKAPLQVEMGGTLQILDKNLLSDPPETRTRN